RFYPLLVISGNVSAIFAGRLSAALSANYFNPSLPFGKNAWDQSIILLTLVLLICSLLVFLIFHWRYNKQLNEREAQIRTENPHRMSFLESLKTLAKSKYLLALALVVFFFNVMTNLAEVIWKDHISFLYPNPSDFHTFMSYITSYIGMFS